MEQQIQGQLMSCLYKQCFEKVFTCNYHSHIECCTYKPLKCLFCKEETSLSYLKYHIRNECTTPYLDYTDSKLKGSDDVLLDRFSHHDTSFKLDMASLSKVKNPEWQSVVDFLLLEAFKRRVGATNESSFGSYPEGTGANWRINACVMVIGTSD
jgi:hypothetical protein